MQRRMSTRDAPDAALAAQYEAFPYPARDPREEAKRLIVGSPSHLREIDHWVFGARRPASMPLPGQRSRCRVPYRGQYLDPGEAPSLIRLHHLRQERLAL